jgi:hypothetical protein
MMKVLLGNIEFGEFVCDGEIIDMALVHRPYRMLTLDEDVAESVAKSLVAEGKYSNFVIPDLFEGEVSVSWRKEDGDE